MTPLHKLLFGMFFVPQGYQSAAETILMHLVLALSRKSRKYCIPLTIILFGQLFQTRKVKFTLKNSQTYFSM